MAACVVVTSPTGGAAFSARIYWTAGMLLAGAISVKPIMILLAPLPVLLSMQAERRRSGQWSVRDQARALAPMAIPGAAASVGWMAYSEAVTGRWFQSTGFVVSKFGNDPTHGLATIRLPTLPELVVMPFLPVVTGVIGQREPFGGRTGLVLVVFIPVMVITVIVMDRDDRLALARLAVPVLASYLIAGIVIVRTRFLLVDYAAAVAAATCTVAWWNRRSPAGWGPVLHWSFRVLVLLGLLDTVRHAVN